MTSRPLDDRLRAHFRRHQGLLPPDPLMSRVMDIPAAYPRTSAPVSRMVMLLVAAVLLAASMAATVLVGSGIVPNPWEKPAPAIVPGDRCVSPLATGTLIQGQVGDSEVTIDDTGLAIVGQPAPFGLGLPLDGYAQQRQLTREGLRTLRSELGEIESWGSCREPRLIHAPRPPDHGGGANVRLGELQQSIVWDTTEDQASWGTPTQISDVKALEAILLRPLESSLDTVWTEPEAKHYLPARWQIEFAIVNYGPHTADLPTGDSPDLVTMPGGEPLDEMGNEVPQGRALGWIIGGHRCKVVALDEAREIRRILDRPYLDSWSGWVFRTSLDGEAVTAMALIRGLRPHEEDCYGASEG